MEHPLIIGLAGQAAITATDYTVDDTTIQLALQVVIGIITLIKLLKNPKPKNNNE